MTTDASMVSARSTDSWVIAVCNQKGGVGKTTLSLSLAAATAEANGRALIADVDPQGSTVEMAERIKDPGYDYLHELDPAKLTQISRVRNYDMIFVDCPGSLEGGAHETDDKDSVLDAVLSRAHFAVIPFMYDPLVVGPTARTARRVAKAGVPYKILLNNIDPRLGAEEAKAAWKLLDDGRLLRFRCFVRGYRAYPNSLRDRVTIMQYRGSYKENVKADISRVHTELLIDLGRVAAGQEVMA